MQGLTPGSVTAYQRALTIFLECLHFRGVEVEEQYEVDDLLVEFRNDPTAWRGKAVSKSNFETLIAALEKALPHHKGTYDYAKQVLASWRVSFIPRHTIPMSRP